MSEAVAVAAGRESDGRDDVMVVEVEAVHTVLDGWHLLSHLEGFICSFADEC